MQTRVGPAWSELGLTYAAPRYPLRVETHLLRLVGRLLPGIITTTTQARMYALHAAAWAWRCSWLRTVGSRAAI